MMEENRLKMEEMDKKTEQFKMKMEHRKEQLKLVYAEKRYQKEMVRERTLENLKRQEEQKEREWR